VQVGAPMDTLKAGRSRGMYFALFAPPTARVIIVEPDPESVAEFRAIVQRLGLTNVTVHQGGAWSEKKLLKLYVDPNHPATNFTEGTVNYSDERLKDFRVVEIPVDTVDNILAQYGITPDLISVTTNGSERDILQGMKIAMQGGLSYVALARTGEGYTELMQTYGYTFYGHDDRGYTYTRS
jgi:FkbM family methyltransferase